MKATVIEPRIPLRKGWECQLARVELDPEELAVVARVLEQIRSSLFPPSLPEEYEGFCNLPQVQAEKKGRKEALDQVAAVLNRIEADYRAGE